MIYIKRFLYLLFLIITTILGFIFMILTILTFPFVSMVDYVVHGKLTKDYIMGVYEWLDVITDKFKPE